MLFLLFLYKTIIVNYLLNLYNKYSEITQSGGNTRWAEYIIFQQVRLYCRKKY